MTILKSCAAHRAVNHLNCKAPLPPRFVLVINDRLSYLYPNTENHNPAPGDIRHDQQQPQALSLHRDNWDALIMALALQEMLLFWLWSITPLLVFSAFLQFRFRPLDTVFKRFTCSCSFSYWQSSGSLHLLWLLDAGRIATAHPHPPSSLCGFRSGVLSSPFRQSHSGVCAVYFLREKK
jgi:hypothetical protein